VVPPYYYDIEDKKKGPLLHGRPWIVLGELNQAAESMGNTPRSFPRMGIAIDIVKDVTFGPEYTESCISFLPMKSNLDL
jgi:hypothetical protein